MNPSSASVASVVLIVSTTIIRRVRDGTWQHHVLEVIVYGFLLLIALLTLAIVIPPAALILAYLGMVGAFVLNGPAVFHYLGNFGRGQGTI